MEHECKLEQMKQIDGWVKLAVTDVEKAVKLLLEHKIDADVKPFEVG